jgi:hypothetical protein
MPTPRKSIEELKLSGTYQMNKSRYKHLLDVPKPIKVAPKSPLGKAPAHLGGPERTIWAEVVKAAPKGRLTRSHRVAVEVLVGLITKLRGGTIKPGEVNTLLATLTKFGLSPETVSEPIQESEPESPEKTAEELAEQLAWDALDELD